MLAISLEKWTWEEWIPVAYETQQLTWSSLDRPPCVATDWLLASSLALIPESSATEIDTDIDSVPAGNVTLCYCAAHRVWQMAGWPTHTTTISIISINSDHIFRPNVLLPHPLSGCRRVCRQQQQDIAFDLLSKEYRLPTARRHDLQWRIKSKGGAESEGVGAIGVMASALKVPSQVYQADCVANRSSRPKIFHEQCATIGAEPTGRLYVRQWRKMIR